MRLPGRARRLGAGRAGPGQRGLAGAHAGLRRAVGRLPAHDADRLGPRGGPARRADGQQRGRPPEPRRGRGRAPGPRAHRRRDRRRLAGAERGAARGVRGRRARAPARARLRRRRALLARAPARADRARRASWRSRTSWCTRSPTGATRCRTPARATWRELDAHAGRARRLGRRALLGDGPRPPLGAHAARLRPARARPRRRTTPTAASRRCSDAYERGETDEFIEPTLVGEEARDPARATA